MQHSFYSLVRMIIIPENVIHIKHIFRMPLNEADTQYWDETQDIRFTNGSFQIRSFSKYTEMI